MTYDMLEPCRKDTQFKNLPLLTFCWLTEKLRHWFHKSAWNDSFLLLCTTHTKLTTGSNGGMMVEALASHKCGLCLNLSVNVTCGLSLLWVLCLWACSKRLFSGHSGFPLSSKTNTSKFQFDKESGGQRIISSSVIVVINVIVIFTHHHHHHHHHH